MHIHLRKRNPDPGIIQRILDIFGKAPLRLPERILFRPAPYIQEHGAVRQAVHENPHILILQNSRLLHQNLQKNLPGLSDILLIGNPHGNIDSPPVTFRIICNTAPGKGSVGEHDRLIIRGNQMRVKNINRINRPLVPQPVPDIIPYGKGL